MEMYSDCINCEQEITYDTNSVGGKVTCPNCGMSYDIDFDCGDEFSAVVILIPVIEP